MFTLANEVVAPHMVCMRGPELHARLIVEPQPATWFLLLWDFEPLTTPDALVAVLAYMPAGMLQQRCNSAITVAAIPLGQCVNGLGQSILICKLRRRVALRAAWPMHQTARNAARIFGIRFLGT